MKLFGKDSGFKQKQFYQSSFVISQTFKSFSKTGIFQFESKNKLNWILKTQFDDNLVKNCHQNSIKTIVSCKIYESFKVHSLNICQLMNC